MIMESPRLNIFAQSMHEQKIEMVVARFMSRWILLLSHYSKVNPSKPLTIIHKERDMYIAWCVQHDILLSDRIMNDIQFQRNR